MDDTQDVQEGEETEEEKTSSASETDAASDATVLLSLEELVKNNLSSIDTLTEEIKQRKQMFVDGFENNPTYREVEDKVKEVNKQKGAVREQILNTPEMRGLAQKIKDMSVELREKKSSISEYLLEYQRLSGSNEIEDLNGEMRDIVNSAKAIKRSSREVATSKRK